MQTTSHKQLKRWCNKHSKLQISMNGISYTGIGYIRNGLFGLSRPVCSIEFKDFTLASKLG